MYMYIYAYHIKLHVTVCIRNNALAMAQCAPLTTTIVCYVRSVPHTLVSDQTNL